MKVTLYFSEYNKLDVRVVSIPRIGEQISICHSNLNGVFTVGNVTHEPVDVDMEDLGDPKVYIWIN